MILDIKAMKERRAASIEFNRVTGYAESDYYNMANDIDALIVRIEQLEAETRRYQDWARKAEAEVESLRKEIDVFRFIRDRPRDERELIALREKGLKGTDAEGWIIGEFVLRALESRAKRD